MQNKANTMKNILKNNSVNKNHLEQYTYSKEIVNQGYAFIDSDTFQKIQKNKFCFDINEKDVCNFIEVHQFRIKAQKNDTGKPTPEGIHRDGVDFVLMAIINRHNVRGGMTKIYDLNKNLKTEFMLENFLDVALIDDHQVYHSVTEIQVNDFTLGDTGLRDVLVITFKKA